MHVNSPIRPANKKGKIKKQVRRTNKKLRTKPRPRKLVKIPLPWDGPKINIPLVDETFTEWLYDFIVNFEDSMNNYRLDGCDVPMGENFPLFYCDRCKWSGHNREHHHSGKLTLEYLAVKFGQDQIRRYAPHTMPEDNVVCAKKFFQLVLNVIGYDLDFKIKRYCNKGVNTTYTDLCERMKGRMLSHKSASVIVKAYNDYVVELVRGNSTLFRSVAMKDFVNSMEDLFQKPIYRPAPKSEQLRKYIDKNYFRKTLFHHEMKDADPVGHSLFAKTFYEQRHEVYFVLPSFAASLVEDSSLFWDDRDLLRLFISMVKDPSAGTKCGSDPQFLMDCITCLRSSTPMPVANVTATMVKVIIGSGLPALNHDYAKRLTHYVTDCTWTEFVEASMEFIDIKPHSISDYGVWIPFAKTCRKCKIMGHRSCEGKSAGYCAYKLAKFIEDRLFSRQGFLLHLAQNALDLLLLAIITHICELEIDMLDSGDLKGMAHLKAQLEVDESDMLDDADDGDNTTDPVGNKIVELKNRLDIPLTRKGVCLYKSQSCSRYLVSLYMAFRNQLMQMDQTQIMFSSSPAELAFPENGDILSNSSLFDESHLLEKGAFIRKNFYVGLTK